MRKSSGELATMRRAGGIVAEMLERCTAAARAGVTTAELDKVARRVLERRGARSNFLNYHGFPAVICTSPNNVIVHGVPGEYHLEEGDILSLACGAIVEGYHGTAAVTIPIGEVSPEARELIEVTEESLRQAIEVIREGNRLSDIGHTVQTIAECAGFSVVREFVGYGIGTAMHEEPQIPNYGPPGRGIALKVGHVFAVEPMVNAGGPGTLLLDDGWSVVTADGSLSAQFAHNIAITEGGPEVLTRAEQQPPVKRDPSRGVRPALKTPDVMVTSGERCSVAIEEAVDSPDGLLIGLQLHVCETGGPALVVCESDSETTEKIDARLYWDSGRYLWRLPWAGGPYGEKRSGRVRLICQGDDRCGGTLSATAWMLFESTPGEYKPMNAVPVGEDCVLKTRGSEDVVKIQDWRHPFEGREEGITRPEKRETLQIYATGERRRIDPYQARTTAYVRVSNPENIRRRAEALMGSVTRTCRRCESPNGIGQNPCWLCGEPMPAAGAVWEDFASAVEALGQRELTSLMTTLVGHDIDNIPKADAVRALSSLLPALTRSRADRRHASATRPMHQLAERPERQQLGTWGASQEGGPDLTESP